MADWKTSADLDAEWHLSDQVGEGWVVLDTGGKMVETVYDIDVGHRIVRDHNEMLKVMRERAG